MTTYPKRRIQNRTTYTLYVVAILAAVLLLPLPAEAREWQVNATAPAGGDGTATEPLNRIQEAVNRAAGGDTIVVQGGVYREEVAISKAYPDNAPLTLRAAEGAQPVMTGMAPISGWKLWRDGIYSAEVEARAKDLFVGAARLSLACWPKVDQPWLPVTAIDVDKKTLTFSGQVPVPQQMRDVKIYAHEAGRMDYEFRPITGMTVEGPGGTVSLSEDTVKKVKSGGTKRFVFFNAKEFITEPGEWALEYLDKERTRLYFKPEKPEDLAATQFRQGGSGIRIARPGANVRISGFIITGVTGSGIGTNRANKIVVENCVLYNNGTGIGLGGSSDITLRKCLVMQNYSGVSGGGIKKLTLEQCEVAFNDEDGITMNGRVYDKASQKIGSSDLRFSQCYVHHHQYQGHPDNIQFFRGVGRTQFEKCLLMYGGQQLMMEQTEEMRLADSVVLASINRSMNLFSYKGEGKKGWDLENNTVGFTRYVPVQFGGPNSRSWANLFFGFFMPTAYDAQGLKSDYDWFWPSPTHPKIASFSIGKTGYTDPSQYATKSGNEAHGRRADPKLRNVPAFMMVAFGGGASSTERLKMDASAAADYFAVGNLVEVNGDGVQRKVTAVEKEFITIAPPLPSAPFRYSVVFNWKGNSNFQLDTRPVDGSPILTAGPDGKAAGSSLNIADYQKGDFDGDGQRDLPAIPAELQKILPARPNRYIYPYAL
ncbi:MAG: right-handed parallel beta-helix repeat-containing protein [Armatimonadota bacterium]|nr:right-handed parallel beta-helix repeat-containing protein [Armatimonadota bacterium]